MNDIGENLSHGRRESLGNGIRDGSGCRGWNDICEGDSHGRVKSLNSRICHSDRCRRGRCRSDGDWGLYATADGGDLGPRLGHHSVPLCLCYICGGGRCSFGVDILSHCDRCRRSGSISLGGSLV